MAEEFVAIKGKRTKRHRAGSPCSGSTSTSDEEEDMANCLILLAQGGATNTDSRRFIAAADYVYHCKTCNRTFSSFQALGGHRASHKKPKTEEEKVTIPITIDRHQLEDSTSTAMSKPNKLHECSICGSEFTSGQALGGHMRRHRAAASTNDHYREKRSRNMLELDLNLPAPEDHLRESKFHFNSAKQSIIFSAPALIDCHY